MTKTQKEAMAEMVKSSNKHMVEEEAKDAEAESEMLNKSPYGKALNASLKGTPEEVTRNKLYNDALKRPGIKQEMEDSADIRLKPIVPAVRRGRSLINQMEDKNQNTVDEIEKIDNPEYINPTPNINRGRNWFNGRQNN